MITLSRILKVSLDYLVSDQSDSQEQAGPASESPSSASPTPAPAAVSTGKIMIRSHDGKQLVNCYKVMSMRVSTTRTRLILPSSEWTAPPSGARTGPCSAGMPTRRMSRRRPRLSHRPCWMEKTSYELQYAAKVKDSNNPQINNDISKRI